jgi:predicted dehydrogenase
MHRVALLGLGAVSRFYAAAFDRVPGLRLVAVCDPDPAALRRWRGRLPSYRDHRGLLAAEAPDAVVVTAPNDRHASICADALAAGAAVCVEKPMAIRLEEAAALCRDAAARGLPLFTAYHRRYNAAVAALLAGLPPAVPVRSVRVRYLERIEEHAGRHGWYLDPRRCGGGCLADNGPNAYDLVRQVVGECRVVGCAIVRDARGVDRQATVTVRSASGATGIVQLDWSYPGECKDVTVELADGRRCRADMLAGYRGFKASLWHEYVGVLADFERALTAAPPGPDPGLAAAAFVSAAYESTVEVSGGR